MAGFVKGEVVVIPFPFSDLSDAKKRPALVLADLPDDDILLCQITSQPGKYGATVALTKADFSTGYLPIDSFIRPTRIFTADKNIIIRRVGKVLPSVIGATTAVIIDLISD